MGFLSIDLQFVSVADPTPAEPTMPDGKKIPPAGAMSGPAVLVLDAQGRVELANTVAHAFWQVGTGGLVGEHIANLFAFEVVSQAPDWLEAQWEVLQSAAQTQPLSLQLQPREAGAFPVVFKLESGGDAPLRWFAQVSRVVEVAPAAGAESTGEAGSEFLRVLYDRGSAGFFDLDFVRQETRLSAAWKRMLGHTDASLPSTYDAWLSLIHPDDSAAAPDKLPGRSATATGARPFNVEYRLRHAQGHDVWVQNVGVRIFGPNGALQRIVGLQLDISERKEAEEAAVRAEEQMQMLGERGRLAMFDFDLVADRAWLSPAFKILLGHDEDSLPDEPASLLRALPPEESSAGLAAYFSQGGATQAAFYEVVRLTHRNGAELWAYAGFFRTFSRKGELQRVTGFFAPMPRGGSTGVAGIPVGQLGALLSELREAVLLTDARGRIVLLNSTAERLLGRTAGEMSGRAAAEIFQLVHRQSGQPSEHPIARALATSEATSLNDECALAGPDGVPGRVITFSCCPAFSGDGQMEGVVLVFRDPDEMGLTPEELIRANRFEALGQLAGGIAHDFNNLLTTILGGISLAKDTRDLSGLENSERACMAAKGLSRQLLNFAKGGSAARQTVRLADVLSDAVRLSSAGAVIPIHLQAPPELANVEVDRAQILQVFQNLIINSLQAMPPGHAGEIYITAGNVTLIADQIPPLPAGSYAAVEVRDNGTGIKPEHLEKIFDPFFTTKKTGTGLGLATVLSIVRHHGGQIGLDSELGVGTTFTVFLPQVDAEPEVEARRAPTVRHGTGRILFMDDDPEITQFTAQMLDSLGFKYDLAKNGDEAIKLYNRYLKIGRPHDLVVLDLTVIGGMGGEDCFKKLREMDPEVRAIVASGYDSDEMARQFLQMGFCGYLAKPYRVGDLNRMIKKVIG